jgi:Flp pilus assembly protein TadD
MVSNPTASPISPMAAQARVDEVSQAANANFARGISLAQKAKADGVDHPLIRQLVAIQLKNEGRFEQAILELQPALEAEPHSVPLLTVMGFCLLELDRRQEAAKIFEVALRLEPNSAEANFGYGWAAERLGSLEVAESSYRRAVALNPNHADALAGLAGTCARRRDWASAQVYAEKAAALDPRQTDALTNLARIEIGQGRFDAAERRLQSLIALPHLKPLARANARLLLGDALDGAGRYRKAFAAYAKGKADLREMHAHVFEPTDGNSATEAVGAILAEFNETPAKSWVPQSLLSSKRDERAHAFLMGFPRSGTTLLEQVLATHPDIATLEERPILVEAAREFLTRDGDVTRLADVVGDLLEPYRDSYWKRVTEFGVDPAGKVFVDKNPLNTNRLPLIAKLFPAAKIIFALRDPRDVVLSCFRRSFNMNASMYEFNSIEGAANYYAAAMEAGQTYLEKLPLQTHYIRYEDLVSDFEGTGRALCDFLSVEWNDKLKDFAQTARSRAIATPSSTQVGRGLYSEGAGQWRNYDFAIKPVLPILQPWIEKFGYEPV